MDDELAKALMRREASHFGSIMAHHTLIERLLVRLYEYDADGLADLERECLDAVDDTLGDVAKDDFLHLSLHHAGEALERIFAGARSLLPDASERRPSPDL